jgi:hypothetical protein
MPDQPPSPRERVSAGSARLRIEPWWAKYEFLTPLQDDWEHVSKPVLIAWMILYVLFLLYAFRSKGQALFIDMVFLPIHEGGHLLFSFLGIQTLTVMGGTLLQLFVPAAIAVYFLFQRHLTGTVFAAFFFFENFLQIGTYMADARAQVLPLVSVGGGEGIHDWGYLFIKFGLINQDVFIGKTTRILGWLGMIAVVVWFWWQARAATKSAEPTKTI